MHVAGYDLFATHALGLPEQNDPSPGLDKFPGRPIQPPPPEAPEAVKAPAPVAAPAVKHGKKDHK